MKSDENEIVSEIIYILLILCAIWDRTTFVCIKN